MHVFKSKYLKDQEIEDLIENSTDIEAMQLQSQGSCSSNDHPPAAKKRKTLGSLFKDNEEERDEMPVISKEQCIIMKWTIILAHLGLTLKKTPLVTGRMHTKLIPIYQTLQRSISAFVQQALPQNAYSVHQATFLLHIEAV